MTFETFARIFALVLVAGWTVATLPSLVTGRWRVGEQKVRWPQLPAERRARIVSQAGSFLILGLGAAFAPNNKLGGMVVLAAMLPGVVTALWWGRIDFGNNHILRRERPADYWMIVVIGALVSAAALWLLFRGQPTIMTP